MIIELKSASTLLINRKVLTGLILCIMVALSGCIYIPVTVPDRAGDADPGYVDITRASIQLWVMGGMNLAFSIQVQELIPPVIEIETHWGFFVDSDRNPATGLRWEGMGADYWIRLSGMGAGMGAGINAWNQTAGQWYRLPEIDVLFEVVGATITIYVDPHHIGSPVTFDFIAFTVDELRGMLDSAPDTGFATM